MTSITPVRRLLTPTRSKAQLQNRLGRYCAILLVVTCTVVFLFPLYWMVITSLKTDKQVFHLPPVYWPWPFKWANYPEALNYFPFLRYVRNTLQIALPVTLGTTISSALVAYGFSRLRWKGRNLVFYLVLATLMIPDWVTLVPLYITFDKLGWINTYKPLIVPSFLGMRSPFSCCASSFCGSLRI